MARPEAWSEEEVAAIVADYFSMLEKELSGIPYSKTAHRRALLPRLRNRTDGSVEKKHQNISAVLDAAHLRFIDGYKPLSQYQQLLADMVLEHLEDDAVIAQLMLRAAEREVARPPVPNVLDLMTRPPDLLASARSALERHVERRQARRVDYLAREARNRSLGAQGELLVVSYERARLSALGRDNLADRVEHVSVTQGDGLGYDVRSFTPVGRERFIEVKTTQLGPKTPFYVTQSEVAFSVSHADDYSLYRVYQFASDPRMFSLDGRVDATCAMTPAQYLAVPRAPSG